MCLRLTLILLTCITSGFASLAQLYPFVNYTPRDGLVGNKVRFITQDSEGKLYFGTSNGLSVYDGSRFTNYSTENGLYSNQVNAVIETGRDSMLIILNKPGIQYLHKGRIQQVKLKDSVYLVINQLIKCSDGNSYAMGDEGLFRLHEDRVTKIKLSGFPGIDDAKNLYRATEFDSLLIINMDVINPAYRSPKLFIVYNYYTGKCFADSTLPDVHFTVRTPDNDLLAATAQGIFTIDKKALKDGKIKLIPPSDEFYTIPPNTVTRLLYFDRRQNLWIATQNGVLKIERGKSPKLFSEENGLPHNTASCIFQDREGIMWFGSDLTGVAKLVDQNLQFYKDYKPGFFIHDVVASRNSDSVWAYSHRDRKLLFIQNKGSREYRVTGNDDFAWITVGKKKIYGNNGLSVYELHLNANGTVSTSPIYKYPGPEGFSTVLVDKKDNPILVGSSITAVLPNHKIITKQLHYYADKAVMTADGFLYIITRTMHLYIYKINADDPENYLELVSEYNWEKNNIEPRSLVVDKNGRLWIGTRQRGLFYGTILQNQFKPILQLTIKDGLTENFVRSLYYDASGNLWAGTPTGLDKITIRGENISIENITKASNMYLDMQKIEACRQGVIWAVATSGLIKVYPAAQVPPPITPQIIFTKFTAGNQEFPVVGTDTNLKYFQNNLSFHVAVPSFFDEKKTLFSYKLEGQGNNNAAWTEPSSQADISFLNLPPGRYHLKVKSVFSNGKYAPLESAYSFTILAPWWQRWWFRLIEFFAALFIIVFLFRVYYRNKLHKQKLMLEKKQAVEQERTRIAIDMHDDMGAGLSRIKVLSETIKFENQKGIVNPAHLQKISVYSEEMMDKMGEIVWALNQRNDSIKDLLGYTRAYAVDYLSNHGIQCFFHTPADAGDAFISGEVRRNIFLSVKEVLHNIIKHAQATTVTITITTGKELSILIHDNGKGIDLDKSRKFGNGLNNIRKRMTEIGGTAEFRNENGTLVILRFPILK